MGHFDTVFEPDSPFQKWRIDASSPDRAYGPGSSDMKGGLVVLLEALRALRASGDLARANVTVLLNADEEIGSLGSRARIQAAAGEAQLALVFEPALEGGEQARSRSGAGQFHLDVQGVAAHVATSPVEGRSAVLALAKKVVAIEALSDHERGILLNVGTISGGTKRNIVPEHAEAWIDVRYDESAQGEEVRGDAGADRRRARRARHARRALGAPAPPAPAAQRGVRPPARAAARDRARARLPGARARALGAASPTARSLPPRACRRSTRSACAAAARTPTASSCVLRESLRARRDRGGAAARRLAARSRAASRVYPRRPPS